MDKKVYVAAAFAVALALALLWAASSSTSNGVEEDRQAASGAAVSRSSVAGAGKSGGVLPADADEANIVPAEFAKPGFELKALREKADSEALDLEKLIEDGDVEWLDLAVQLKDPRPLMDVEERFACKRLLKESCSLDVRLVIHREGDVLYASGYTGEDSQADCDAYAACMTQHYTQRSFPHGSEAPLAVLLSRHTGEPYAPFFEDPVKIRSIVSVLSEDLAAAESSPDFDTPSLQLRYRLQKLGVEGLEAAASKLEEEL